MFRLKGCGAAEPSCFFYRLPALSAFLLSVTSMELCLIASYRSKGLPPTPGTGRNWNGVVAAGRG